MNDNFKFTIPAQLVKSDGDGYKIAGLASTEALDKQGEILMQKGIDLSAVDEGKGFFNFDHSNKPEDLIGIIDSYSQGRQGLYVKGSLFKGHPRAEAVRSIMKGLKEKNIGAVGFSVEGQILERDPVNPKIIKKCKIKNVALTFNPVNSDTYVSLIKSMTEDAEIEFDSTKANNLLALPDSDNEKLFSVAEMLNIVEKALGISGGYTQAPNKLVNGDALATSDMGVSSKKKKKKEKSSIPVSKDMYKSMMMSLMNELQVLYPYNTREDLWDAVKTRMSTKFPEALAANEEN